MLLGGVVGILRTGLHKFFASAINPSVSRSGCQLPLHRGAGGDSRQAEKGKQLFSLRPTLRRKI